MFQAPANLPVRPTTDYAKSALFNILTNRIDFTECTVLDLFAGIGGVSLEFASRGAKSIISVDSHAPCLKFIRETSEKLGIKTIETIRSDVFKYLKSCDRKFDLIFADAPFEMSETDQIPELVFEHHLLKEDGILIVEHQSKRILKSTHIPEVRTYGNCAFSFFKAI
jgi:16S rRNA (guanine(966)-N(2))-methyltransferase RsmD